MPHTHRKVTHMKEKKIKIEGLNRDSTRMKDKYASNRLNGRRPGLQGVSRCQLSAGHH